MHATRGAWAGQAFALATGSDSGGKKSRIRRSKEERKTMVESFIKRYQKSNHGNFPSLNLTHKKVGGSFYTVREIVREIIQENRVLAPPKESSEEHNPFEFLEHHPLGSISMEPHIDLSVPVQIIQGISEVADGDENSDRRDISYHTPSHYQDIVSAEEDSNREEQLPLLETHKLDDEKIVNGFQEKASLSNKPLITNGDCRENNDNALLSSQGLHNKNTQTVDKMEKFRDQIYAESAMVDREKYGAQEVEASHAAKSHMNSSVVVETFPLRPIPRTTHNMDGESSETGENKATEHDTRKFVESSSGLVNEKGKEKLSDSKVEMDGAYRDERLGMKIQSPSVESSKYSSASKTSIPDIGEVADLQSKDSSADGTKAGDSTKWLISEDTAAVTRKSNDEDNTSLPKGKNPSLDRINLETWEGSSKKSSNPLLTFVKAFISSFMKFWTE